MNIFRVKLYLILSIHMTVEVFAAMKIEVALLWVLTTSNHVVGQKRFGQPCWQISIFRQQNLIL